MTRDVNTKNNHGIWYCMIHVSKCVSAGKVLDIGKWLTLVLTILLQNLKTLRARSKVQCLEKKINSYTFQ